MRKSRNRIRRQWVTFASNAKLPGLSRGRLRKDKTDISHVFNLIYHTNRRAILGMMATRIPIGVLAIFSTILLGTSSTTTLSMWIIFLIATTTALRPIIVDISSHLNRLKRISLELPTDLEKLGIYLGAGHSISGAIRKIASNASGSTFDLFRNLENSLNSGMELEEALDEIKRSYPTNSVKRMATALESANFGANLPRVVRQEANAQRIQIQRDSLALMEKNAQKIWIPITIAALVPGIILIFVPFLSVMKSVTGA